MEEPRHLKYKGRVVFGKQSMPSFERMPKDYVKDEACFVILNKGELNIRAPEETLQLQSNTGVLAKCMNYFLEGKKDAHDNIEVIAIILYPDMVEEIFDFDLSKYQHKLNFEIKQVILDELLSNFKESIILLIDNPELADENVIKTKLKEFVLLITRMEQIPSEFEFLAGIFEPANIGFKSVVEKNLYSNLSVDELAHLCHLSVSSFKRKFKEVFDDSPKKYINQKRINRAADLLVNSDLRISDIAYDVGYDSLSTFNRNFTEFYGKTPSDFRLS